MRWRDGYIAVDWGTTNRRVYSVDGDGRLAGSTEDDLGIMAIGKGGFESAVAEIRDRFANRPVLLAGMIGSNRGWREAPYVQCPAGAAELAAAILWLEPDAVGIVPGLSFSGEGRADVMRGEEVQIVGAAAAGLVPPDALICHPGTHSKWIVTSGGRIESFRTMMTGELFGLLRRHSILADQLGGPVTPDSGFLAGAAAGLAGEDLLSALFAIRARRLLGQKGGSDAAYASGLLIGADVRAGLGPDRQIPIALIGRSDLRKLYAAVLEETGRTAVQVDGATAFLAGIHVLTEML